MGYQVIIPAAGSGRRMGAGQNKLLLKVAGAPIIVHTLRVFESDSDCNRIILAVKPEEREEFERLVKEAGFKKIGAYVQGGGERQDSVREGLSATDGDGVVVIHDGARPFVTADLIKRVVQTAETWGAAIAAVPVKDTIKKVIGDQVKETVNRESLWAAQTPQAFRRDLIIRAHQWALENKLTVTDDASLVEAMGEAVRIVQGDDRNIKITTRNDLLMAEFIIKTEMRENANAHRTRV
jgi:2-C-methyl-D-erythritol 4-phosphate cytidylyltransferase